MRLVCCAAVALLASAGVAHAATIRVPQDATTVTKAIAAARPGDEILLSPGRYPGGYVVPAGKDGLTIRGLDRNRVVLDGAARRKNGIVVHADGVSLLNLSATGFLENGFYWEDADRFRASYLTAWNIRGYGIYVEDGQQGTIDHDYVSGAADAAYYVGECNPCGATIHHVVATLSAVGYSGTNSSGVVIRDSTWTRNGAGIVPNTYANEALPPEARTTIVRNTISGSGTAAVPIHTALAGFVGVGIAIAGGNENTVTGNRVLGSERYGIAVFPTARYVTFNSSGAEPGPPWRPHGNRISGNVVRGSGTADLALATGSGRGNCFSRNTAASALPASLLRGVLLQGGCATGDASVAAELAAPVRVMVEETMTRRRPPSFTSLPAPPPQPQAP